jgi:hypothetical protein
LPDQQPKRDKVNLDLFWLKDRSLEESDDLPEPEVLRGTRKARHGLPGWSDGAGQPDRDGWFGNTT